MSPTRRYDDSSAKAQSMIRLCNGVPDDFVRKHELSEGSYEAIMERFRTGENVGEMIHDMDITIHKAKHPAPVTPEPKRRRLVFGV